MAEPGHARTIRGGLNYLGQMRIVANLSQINLSALLGLDTSTISRHERAEPSFFETRRSEVIEWARACNVGPTDANLQAFLLYAGTAPWLPSDKLPVLIQVVVLLAADDGLPLPDDASILDGLRGLLRKTRHGRERPNRLSGHDR